MNCLIFVQNYPPEIGPVRYTYDLANTLYKAGNKISVVTEFPHYPTGQNYSGFEKNNLTIRNENGIEVIRVPVLRAPNTSPFKRILGFFTFFISSIPQLIKNRNADIIIVSIPSFITLYLGILGKFLFGIPFIVLLRDIEPYDSLFQRGLINNRFVAFLVKFFTKSYSLADAIVTVCPGQSDTIRKLGVTNNRVELITRPISLTFFNEAPALPGENNNSMNRGNIKGLYVGTFGKCHCLPDLMNLLVSTQISRLPIDFVFIGDGEDRIKCTKLISSADNSRVRLYKPIPYEQVPQVLQSADFLIYSENVDRLDTLGSKFYEYLASAKPVLVCGKSHAADIIKELQNGWCLDIYDVEKLSGCLQMIVADRLKFGEIGMKGRVYMSNCEKNNYFGETWINLCNSVIDYSE